MKYTSLNRHVLVFLFLFSGLNIICWNAQAEIYKWTDDNGQVHFGDSIPQERESEQITVKVNTYTSPSIEGLSKVFNSNPKSKQGSRSKRVVMYSASWCGICTKARKYFKKNNISFVEYDVETSAEGKRAFKKLNGKGVPIILVNNKRMNGFSPNNFQSLFK